MPKPREDLTRKQKAFADTLLANPKQPAAQAAKAVYNVSTPKAAAAIASENLAKPSIQIYLDKHVSLAKARIVSIAKSGKDETAIRAAQDILDREYGKPTQQIETRTQSVNINIDLSRE